MRSSAANGRKNWPAVDAARPTFLKDPDDAFDRLHSVGFFPPQWARVPPAVLGQLSPECHEALVERLAGQRTVG